MAKTLLFVCAALCACAFATWFDPKPYPSMWHVSYPFPDDVIDGQELIIHEYGMWDDDNHFYLYEEGFNASDLKQKIYVGVVRGDINVSWDEDKDKEVKGLYYQQIYLVETPDGYQCRDNGTNGGEPHDFEFSSNMPFEYNEKKTVDCPGSEEGTMGCTEYTSTTGKDKVIVNHAGRYVVDPKGFEITWYNDVKGLDIKTRALDLSYYAVTMCNGTEIPTPADPASKPQNNVYQPDDFPCIYHLSYPWYDEDFERDNIIHEIGMSKGDDFFYLEIGVNPSNYSEWLFYAVVRGDIPFGKGKVYRVDHNLNASLGGYDCVDDKGQDRYDNPDYEYVEVEEIPCPGLKDKKCNLYTNISGDFAIATKYDDPKKHGEYVFDPYGWNVTWYTTGDFAPIFDGMPSVEDLGKLVGEKCNGDKLSPVKNLCGGGGGSSSKKESSGASGASGASTSSAASYAISAVLMVLAAIALLL